GVMGGHLLVLVAPVRLGVGDVLTCVLDEARPLRDVDARIYPASMNLRSLEHQPFVPRRRARRNLASRHGSRRGWSVLLVCVGGVPHAEQRGCLELVLGVQSSEPSGTVLLELLARRVAPLV